MALTIDTLELVLQSLAQGGDAAPSRKIVSLGYPDLLVGLPTLTRLFGDDFVGTVDRLGQQAVDTIARTHGAKLFTSMPELDEGMVDAYSLFSRLGCELEVFDVIRHDGREILVDMNRPLPEDYVGRYAIALDCGTIEHCFDVFQAMSNLARCVAVGGSVLQSNPLNMANHGFYNFSPTFYFDFYEANGFEITFSRIVVPTPENPYRHSYVEGVSRQRLRGCPDNSTNLVVARKKVWQDEIACPRQSIYAAGSERTRSR